MRRIVLVRPENVYAYNNYPPLGLISVGSALRAAGYDVTVVNAALEPDPLGAVGALLDGALLVGISVLTSEVPDALRIARFVKEHSDVPVVMGGWHCTLFPEQTAESDLVDYVVAGEGEEHIVAIADALRDGREPAMRVWPKQFLDMERIPAPDYGLVREMERYITGTLTDKFSETVRKPMRWIPYESSRGCPSQCTFCINVVADNQRYRKKSAGKVLDELETIVRDYRITHVKFVDDNFFVDIARVRAICEGLLERGLDITWDGECRVDYFNDRMLNDETLDLCVRSGLVEMTLGVESGSQHTLDLMRKQITVEQARFAIERCNAHRIFARSSFILEIPGETLADIKETIRLINDMRRYPYYTAGVNTFRPYPRCELTQKLIEEGYLTEPTSLEEWTDRQTIEIYTAAEYVRPWQVNGRYSEAVAHYLSMESSIRLMPHQIDRARDRFVNSLFVGLAWLRNRTGFYSLTFDKDLYKRFQSAFYRRKQRLAKAAAEGAER